MSRDILYRSDEASWSGSSGQVRQSSEKSDEEGGFDGNHLGETGVVVVVGLMIKVFPR